MTTKEYSLICAARTRTWGIILLHLLCAPVGSAVYSSKQKNWKPFWTATLVFFVGCFTWVFDFGATASIGAPVTSIVMLSGKAGESRRRLGIHDPIEADALLYNGGSVVEKVNITGNTL